MVGFCWHAEWLWNIISAEHCQKINKLVSGNLQSLEIFAVFVVAWPRLICHGRFGTADEYHRQGSRCLRLVCHRRLTRIGWERYAVPKRRQYTKLRCATTLSFVDTNYTAAKPEISHPKFSHSDTTSYRVRNSSRVIDTFSLAQIFVVTLPVTRNCQCASCASHSL